MKESYVNISFNLPKYLYNRIDDYNTKHHMIRDDFIVVAIKEKLEREALNEKTSDT
jgi:metal-responsive CopG/Arc/MetJ family transcriptional regulator